MGWIQGVNKKHCKATKSRKPWSLMGPKTQRERIISSEAGKSWSLRRETPHQELLPWRIASVFRKHPEEVNEYSTLLLQPFILLLLLALPVDWTQMKTWSTDKAENDWGGDNGGEEEKMENNQHTTAFPESSLLSSMQPRVPQLSPGIQLDENRKPDSWWQS